MSRLFDFASTPRLETARLILRGIRPVEDLGAFYDLFADPAVAHHTDTGPFTTLDEAAEVMAWITEIFASRTGIRWAITAKNDGDALIGTCGYNRWYRSNNSAEIGYDLVQSSWGAGLMTEALDAMIGFGFEHMGLNRIEADVTVGNDRSARVLEKLGFREEGLLRQRGYWRDEYHDLRFFGLIREDWDGSR